MRTAAIVLLTGLFCAYLVEKFTTIPTPRDESSKTFPTHAPIAAAPKPSPTVAVAPDPVVTPPADLSSDPEYPYARFVQVTDFRAVANEDRSEVDYLVVNHSSSELTDIALKISVRSATAPAAAPPLFNLAARVPLLAPHQSKEIRTTLDIPFKKFPPWDTLRTEVKILSGTQP